MQPDGGWKIAMLSRNKARARDACPRSAIVNTPAQALETFLATGIDSLFLENALVRRR